MDSVALSWLHGTITVELQDIICDEANTSRQAWLALEEQFLENQDARVPRRPVPPFLSRGSLRGEYCRQMKGMTNSLRDLGEPIADRTLVLNLMRGLSLRYGHLKALIKRTVPFPTFDVVRSQLLLEELTMVTKAPTPAPTLYSAPPGGQAPSVGQTPRPPSTEPLPAVLPWPLRLLVRLPPSPEVVAPARATAGVTARRCHHSTTPGPGPSPCGRVRPQVSLVLQRRLS
jgi:hypothetical protein